MWNHDGSHHMMAAGGLMAGYAVLTLILLMVAVGTVLANHFLHVARDSRTARPTIADHPDARLVLDQRLAQGDIELDEYVTLRAVLEE